MSSYKDFKEEKCWSCEHYCANRKVTRDAFGIEYISVDRTGKCSAGSLFGNAKEVSDIHHCGYYKRWSEIQKLLEKENGTKKKENKKQIEHNPNEVEESYKDSPLFSSIHFRELTQQQEIYIEQCENKIKLCKKVSLVTLILSPIIFLLIFFIVTWFSLTAGILTLMVMGIVYAIELPLVLIVCIARVKYLRYRISNTR